MCCGEEHHGVNKMDIPQSGTLLESNISANIECT
jgi:hypothetical protein